MYEDDASAEGIKAKDACCACGGGITSAACCASRSASSPGGAASSTPLGGARSARSVRTAATEGTRGWGFAPRRRRHRASNERRHAGKSARLRRRRERPCGRGAAHLVRRGEFYPAGVGRGKQQLRLRQVRGGSSAVQGVHRDTAPAVAAHAAVHEQAEPDDAEHGVDLVDGRQVAVVLALARARVAEEGLGEHDGRVRERGETCECVE